MSTLAVALGGTDLGASGIGVYLRSILPHLGRSTEAQGRTLLLLGTERELSIYAPLVPHAAHVVLPASCDHPALGALYYLLRLAARARAAGADALLLPAGNRRVALGAGLPTLAVVHDLAQVHVRHKYDVLRMLYVRKLLVAALRRSTMLVSVSACTARDVEAVVGRPSVIIPNGVDAARFADAPGAQRASDRPYVLYLARLEHPGKNHLRLLQAFADSPRLAGHDLVFAGKDWGAQAAIEAQVLRLGLRDRVRLLGFVADAAVPALVRGADAVAMVGLHEGFGLPALEALAAGRPVVVSRTGALPEVVGELGALCDPYDCGSIAEALQRALFDGTLRTAARDLGPALAAARDWRYTADALSDACRVLEAA